MTCVVTLRGKDGCQHSVDVTASTLYEAAVRGLRELQISDWVREETYDAAELVITVRTPAVVHRVDLRRLKEWLSRTAGSPRDVSRRSRLKELLDG